MADVNRGKRPLSPFMLGKYYRLQYTSVTSILTRITGISMLLAGLMIVWWFAAAATGPGAFAVADFVITSWIGDLIMVLSVWALCYHLLAGLRHLWWDSGRGFDLPSAQKLAYGVVGGSFVLTLIVLIFV
ncbi:MAG: succinate dehydrogenase, cytochrome b556 subunit [Qingshengfaniella sp.]